jgi:hypothetical protein
MDLSLLVPTTNMRFSALASLLVFFAVTTLADTVAYDQTYDNASNSLNIVVRVYPMLVP